MRTHTFSRLSVLAVVALVLPVGALAEEVNRTFSPTVVASPGGTLADGTELFDVASEFVITTSCEEFTNLGTVATLRRNGEPAASQAFNVLSNGGDALAACNGADAVAGDSDPCLQASPCTSFFPNVAGEELFPTCALHEGFGRPASCRCAARIPVTFYGVALLPGDEVTLEVAPSPVATAPESFTDDDAVRFVFEGPGEPNCVASARTLCLQGGRFAAELRFTDFDGDQGPGWAVATGATSGYFWFFRPDDMELGVKVLDGRRLNGAWWVFYGALSNVEYTLRVTDTATGEVRTYLNPAGELASHADLRAFVEVP